jgi:hypothetical protein
MIVPSLSVNQMVLMNNHCSNDRQFSVHQRCIYVLMGMYVAGTNKLFIEIFHSETQAVVLKERILKIYLQIDFFRTKRVKLFFP